MAKKGYRTVNKNQEREFRKYVAGKFVKIAWAKIKRGDIFIIRDGGQLVRTKTGKSLMMCDGRDKDGNLKTIFVEGLLAGMDKMAAQEKAVDPTIGQPIDDMKPLEVKAIESETANEEREKAHAGDKMVEGRDPGDGPGTDQEAKEATGDDL